MKFKHFANHRLVNSGTPEPCWSPLGVVRVVPTVRRWLPVFLTSRPFQRRPECLKGANSGSRPPRPPRQHGREARGLRDQSRRKPLPGRSTRRTGSTSVAGAILVNAPTLKGWYLLQGQAVAISCTTGIYALLFGGPSRREGERGEIVVARMEFSCTRWQKHCEEYGDNGKRPLATFHGL